jgi:hypothetical protein
MGMAVTKKIIKTALMMLILLIVFGRSGDLDTGSV